MNPGAECIPRSWVFLTVLFFHTFQTQRLIGADEAAYSSWNFVYNSAGPSARRQHASASSESILLIHGGRNASNAVLSDLWMYDYDANVWSKLSTWDDVDVLDPLVRPCARYGHSIAYYDGVLVLFSGYSHICVDYCGDFWSLNLGEAMDGLAELNWTSITNLTLPTKRFGHSSVQWEQYMLIFGGYTGRNDFLCDLWAYHLVNATFTEVNATGGNCTELQRMYAAAAVDSSSATLYLYGGYRNTNPYWLHDLWAVDLGPDLTGCAWRQVYPLSSRSPSPRYGSVGALVDNIFLVHGGRDNNYHFLDDVWQFNLTGQLWSEMRVEDTSSSGTARGFHTASLHSGNLWLFGGYQHNDSFSVVFDDLRYLNLSHCVNDCSWHGSCTAGWCVCYSAYYGVDCSYSTCPGADCWYNTTAHEVQCEQCGNDTDRGYCDGASRCVCNYPFAGPDCMKTMCRNFCSPNATRIEEVFPSQSASIILNLNHTDGVVPGWGDLEPYFANGYCNDSGSCLCFWPYYGDDCSLHIGCMSQYALNYDSTASINDPAVCTYSGPISSGQNFTLVLQLDIEYTYFLGNRSTLQPTLLSALSATLGVSSSRLVIVDVSEGSTVVVLQICDPPTDTASGRVYSASNPQTLASNMGNALGSESSAAVVAATMQVSLDLGSFTLGSTVPDLLSASVTEMSTSEGKRKYASVMQEAQDKLVGTQENSERVDVTMLFLVVWLALLFLP